jgi:hypothetical protein
MAWREKHSRERLQIGRKEGKRLSLQMRQQTLLLALALSSAPKASFSFSPRLLRGTSASSFRWASKSASTLSPSLQSSNFRSDLISRRFCLPRMSGGGEVG